MFAHVQVIPLLCETLLSCTLSSKLNKIHRGITHSLGVNWRIFSGFVLAHVSFIDRKELGFEFDVSLMV